MVIFTLGTSLAGLVSTDGSVSLLAFRSLIYRVWHILSLVVSYCRKDEH